MVHYCFNVRHCVTSLVVRPSGLAIACLDRQMTISEETDQVFKGVSGDVLIDDAGNSRKLTVSNTGGWTDTVVWNPYGNAGKRRPAERRCA